MTVTGEPSALQQRLARIEDQIASACTRAGRSRQDVHLMAVSKTHPAESVLEAIAAGVTLFGENRVQEFARKFSYLAGLDQTPPHVSFHLIGHLQSNKATKAVELFESIDTLDSLRLAERLNEAAVAQDVTRSVLLEIKLSNEQTKTGLNPQSTELAEVLEHLQSLTRLKVRGLMTVPPYSPDAEASRPYFIQLRELRDQLAQGHPELDFSELSMGMSGDYAVAIEEGATMVRIGTALFGQRAALR